MSRPCRDVTEPSATARPQRPRLADSKATARTAPAKRATGRGARAGCGRGARAHTRRERRDDGVDAVDAAERPRERADSEAAAREASEADARPKPPQRESKRRTRVLEAATRQRHTPRETTTGIHEKKTHTQVLDIHGRQKQQKRTSTFFEFCRATSGVLLCTDVAARGLDIPEVNWIVQFDPPDDPREYVHRVGRTARGETGTGRALLFLAPAELGFLRWLRDARVALHEYEFDMSKVTNIQSALTKLVEKNYYLHRAARDAYRSYLLAYASHAHKDIFDVHALDLQAVSESFGFAVPPRVDLNLSHRGDKKTRRNPKKGDRRKGQSGHAFSAANPYGTKSAGDARQFSY